MGADPVTLATIGIGLSLASTAAATAQAISAAGFQKKTAERAAALAQQEAEGIATKAQVDQLDQDEAARQQMAGLLAEYGASGIDATVGSALVVRANMESLARRDAARIREGGRISAADALQRKADAEQAAKNASFAQKFAIATAPLAIGSAAVSGAITLQETEFRQTQIDAYNAKKEDKRKS